VNLVGKWINNFTFLKGYTTVVSDQRSRFTAPSIDDYSTADTGDRSSQRKLSTVEYVHFSTYSVTTHISQFTDFTEQITQRHALVQQSAFNFKFDDVFVSTFRTLQQIFFLIKELRV